MLLVVVAVVVDAAEERLALGEGAAADSNICVNAWGDVDSVVGVVMMETPKR